MAQEETAILQKQAKQRTIIDQPVMPQYREIAINAANALASYCDPVPSLCVWAISCWFSISKQNRNMHLDRHRSVDKAQKHLQQLLKLFWGHTVSGHWLVVTDFNDPKTPRVLAAFLPLSFHGRDGPLHPEMDGVFVPRSYSTEDGFESHLQ
jgi:hypothetical protein